MANYYVRSGATGAADGTTWADAYTTITAALSGKTGADTLWVANDHSVTAGGNITWTCPTSAGLRILGVNTAATEPPTAVVTTPVAQENCGAATGLFEVRGFAYIHGLILRAGTTGSSANSVNLCASAFSHAQVLTNCYLELPGTSAAVKLQLGSTGNTQNDDSLVTLNNCRVSFGATGQKIVLAHARIVVNGLTINSGGSSVTTLFSFLSAAAGSAVVDDSDLTGVSYTNLIDRAGATPATFVCRDTKCSALVVTGTSPASGGPAIFIHNCSTGSGLNAVSEATYEGTILNETTIDRSANGGGFQSYRMDSSANAAFQVSPLVSPRGSTQNTTTGSSVTVTVPIIHSGVGTGTSGALLDTEIALFCSERTTSSSPQGSTLSDAAGATASLPLGDLFATAADQTTSSHTWDSSPATPVKQQLAVTMTPQNAGPIDFWVALYKPSVTVYIDLGGAVLS